MANCHELFLQFNKEIKLSDRDREILITARNSLRGRIDNLFMGLNENDRGNHTLLFQSQGSFIMDTIIKPYQNDYDLDDGVYFLGTLSENERANPKIFHELVKKTIDKHKEIEEIVDKPTCVRVKYYKNSEDNRPDFHIDLPIYNAEKMESPKLADTKKGWIESNPVEFISWFEDKIKSGFNKSYLLEEQKYQKDFHAWLTDIRKKDSQLRRLVRYVKAWADLKRKDMPSGIMMTIYVANNFNTDERDDIAFLNTLENIQKYISNNGFICRRPTTLVGEDLFLPYSNVEKQFFGTALNNLIISARQACASQNQKEACLKWQRHLGERFPCQFAKDEIEGSKIYSAPAIIKGDSARSA